jgi:hypothetical protein
VTKWDVFFTATKISKGLELDFFDSAAKESDPPRQLKKFDVLNIEVTARRTKFEGMVVEVRPSGEVVILAQEIRWLISPATENDVVHPIKTLMHPQIWIVREQLS